MHIRGSKAYIKDLRSRSGTYFLYADSDVSEKLDDQERELISGQLVTFGKLHSIVQFVEEDVHLCLTRLDKEAKNKVKTYATLLGGKILDDPDAATHIVTNSISGATAKILTAIVFKKNIVTADYFSFANITCPSVEIPPLERYFYRDRRIDYSSSFLFHYFCRYFTHYILSA